MTPQRLADIALGTAGATSPAWLPVLNIINQVAAACAGVMGVLLLAVRLAIAWREWSTKARRKEMGYRTREGD